jgi:hypothetical protein
MLDISSLEGVNGGRQAQLIQIRQKHLDVIDTSDVGAMKIESVDIGEVSIRIKSIQTSLEASYITTRMLLELSFVKFMK